MILVFEHFCVPGGYNQLSLRRALQGGVVKVITIDIDFFGEDKEKDFTKVC